MAAAGVGVGAGAEADDTGGGRMPWVRVEGLT